MAAIVSKWRKENRDAYKRSQKNSQLKKKYGITIDEFDALNEAQSGLCAICYRPETLFANGTLRSLSVDHCHETGRIRGLLCCKCNRAIGMLGDSTEHIRQVLNYLEGTK